MRARIRAARLAVEPHWFGGERQICFHFHTYGFLIGELIRGVGGRGPRQFLKEEILNKVGADFQIGLSLFDELQRLAAPVMPKDAFVFEGILALAGRRANQCFGSHYLPGDSAGSSDGFAARAKAESA